MMDCIRERMCFAIIGGVRDITSGCMSDCISNCKPVGAPRRPLARLLVCVIGCVLARAFVCSIARLLARSFDGMLDCSVDC